MATLTARVFIAESLLLRTIHNRRFRGHLQAPARPLAPSRVNRLSSLYKEVAFLSGRCGSSSWERSIEGYVLEGKRGS